MNKSALAVCSVLLLLFCQNLNAQIDTSFVVHLWKQQLELEHFTYLTQDKNRGSDTGNYHLAKFYIAYENEPMFFESFQNSENLLLSDTSAMNLASIWLLKGNNRSRWFDSCVPRSTFIPEATRQAINIHHSIVSPVSFDAGALPAGLQDDFLLYRKSYLKKPINSLVLSACVPGLGKLYIGNKRSAALTFISMAALGLQSAESYRKVGITHPLTVINLGFFATYYAVNLLGSYRETRLKSREIRNQYLIHASTYYRYKYRDQLYH